MSEIDWPEEIAWTLIEKHKWIPTPQLLFAIKDYIREEYKDDLVKIESIQSNNA